MSTASLDETEAAVRASFAAVRASPAVAAAETADALRWRRPSWDAPPAALPSPFPGGASALARVAPIRKDTHEVRLLWPLGYSLRPPASCGRDDFREILTGKTMENRYRRTW